MTESKEPPKKEPLKKEGGTGVIKTKPEYSPEMLRYLEMLQRLEAKDGKDS